MNVSILPRFTLPFCGLLASLTVLSHALAAEPRWVISGNENKIDLTSGSGKWVPNAGPDSLTLLDFAAFPPRVQHLTNLSNSVIGPPSNIAITPDGALALVADSIRPDPSDPTKWLPAARVHVLHLRSSPPQLIGEVATGPQPSGISMTRDGKVALVANRADSSISVLSIRGTTVQLVQTVPVCDPTNSLSDVAIAPNGLVLASAQKGCHLRLLHLNGTTLTPSSQRISVYGQPYRTMITPDGSLGLTAGQGFGNGLDADALSIIDLEAKPIRTVGYVPLGAVPESFELSADGRLLAAVMMNGSNLPANDPLLSNHGIVVLLERRGKSFVQVDSKPVGRIPEGVAFSPDGKHLIVQCHPDRNLWVFGVRGNRLKDTGLRIPVPGMPSSLRAGP
jgi:DNA-binding beta-propeller fold protein YncE